MMDSSKIKQSKRSLEDKSSDRLPKKQKLQEDGNRELSQYLSPVKAYILQAGIEKMRMTIFKTQLAKYGGKFCESLTEDVTHLIVDDRMTPDRLCRLLKLDKPPDKVHIVKSLWLSSCLKQQKLVDISEYLLECSELGKSADAEKSAPETAGQEPQNVSKSEFPKVGMMFGHRAPKFPLKDDDADSDYSTSDDESRLDALPITSSSTDTSPSTSPKKNLPVGRWICAQSSKAPSENFNKHITDKLEEMVHTYESTNDKWRAFGYQKAIQVLRKHPKPITSFEEALALPSIGKRLAEKIWEIAESGELRKLNEFKSSDEIRVIEQFMNVWGAGAHTARTWYQQGFRTLEDLRTKANLTHQQKVGLRCYDDFLDRMPRSEAAEIEKVVKEAAESLQEGIIAQACGSYRRGKATCGDVDVLVTHPDGKSHKGIFGKLLAKLKQQDFLTDDLVTAEDNGHQKKYLGVCKLPGDNRKYRRLDIIVVPYDEYACALVYFTGSAHLNRSLRHLAKKMGMSLSEHSLNTGVVRNGSEKIFEGTPVPTPTEESVFTQLGVPYRPPEERDH